MDAIPHFRAYTGTSTRHTHNHSKCYSYKVTYDIVKVHCCVLGWWESRYWSGSQQGIINTIQDVSIRRSSSVDWNVLYHINDSLLWSAPLSAFSSWHMLIASELPLLCMRTAGDLVTRVHLKHKAYTVLACPSSVTQWSCTSGSTVSLSIWSRLWALVLEVERWNWLWSREKLVAKWVAMSEPSNSPWSE